MNPNQNQRQYDYVDYQIFNLVPPKQPTTPIEMLARRAYADLVQLDQKALGHDYAQILLIGSETIEGFYSAVVQTAIGYTQSNRNRYIALLALCLNGNNSEFVQSDYYELLERELIKYRASFIDLLHQYISDMEGCELMEIESPADQEEIDRITAEQHDCVEQVDALRLQLINDLPKYISLVRYIILTISYYGVFTLWLDSQFINQRGSTNVQVEFDLSDTDCDEHNVEKHVINTMKFHCYNY